ncbi:MAG: peptide MFS transporter [Phycisphaerae bacterium]
MSNIAAKSVTDSAPGAINYARDGEPTIFGHPPGLFLLFFVEMWERFSYYGMRGLLVLFLVCPPTGMLNPPQGRASGYNPGPGWTDANAATLYGWYTGLAYLFPILGGIIADKLIGTHRSMVIGGLIIALGHIALAVSGQIGTVTSQFSMTIFVFGLALIVLGTGHFKPSVSVMVGQLYAHDDPRRDGAFSIFYMGINLGAFICNLVCGTLAYRVGWHWGFGAAAVGMLAGLAMYLSMRPTYLRGIGEPAPGRTGGEASLLLLMNVGLAALFAAVVHFGWIQSGWARVGEFLENPTAQWGVPAGMLIAMLAFCAWFVMLNRSEDRGPVACIFIFMFFNAFFWIAFEQAGSSLNLFTDRFTDRTLSLGSWSYTIDTPLFQSVNPLLIIIGAPIFAWIWGALGKRKMNPGQPIKIALGLLFLGLGYLFIFWGAQVSKAGVSGTTAIQVSMFFLLATYFWHTVGELCLSPTGLSFVTKVAPVRFVSLLMGIWFVSSFIANLGGGLLAAKVGEIERGDLKLWWRFGGQADFFFLFVVSSVGAGILILILTPLLRKALHGREEA